MSWQTICTMAFAIISVFGGLGMMLGIAFFKHNPNDDS